LSKNGNGIKKRKIDVYLFKNLKDKDKDL